MSREKLISHLKSKKRAIAPDQPVTIELFKPEDALGVSLAYYEIYGDSFPIKHVYDPKEIRKRNATNNQYTSVARTPQGEIIGLAGLFRYEPNKNVYEIGQLMILKSYRSGELSEKLINLLLDDLPRRNNIGLIFGEAVCNHLVSQRLVYLQGLRPTGFAFECMPIEIYATEGKITRNVSLLLMFAVKNDHKHTVYLPERYERYITDLYKTLGLLRIIAPGSELTGETVFNDIFLPDAKLARINVEKSGVDFSSIIDSIEKKAGNKTLFQVYININDEASPAAINVLLEKGYIFGGLLPLWFGCDGILMQKLIREPDWDEIWLLHTESKEMLNYFRNDYDSLIAGKH